MCGIAGVVRRGDERPDPQLLARMAARMVHRGPDEEGFHVGAGVGLAFRRLRVVDLETGSQPQANEDGSVRVVFNGEIYNHAELRDRLIARGHRFRTRSDTEVLVHLYEDLGSDLVRELNGMFAFAIWDTPRRTLLLARDPLGIKPLLWTATPRGLAFASEAGPLLEIDDVDTGLDPVAVQEFLSWGAVPAPRTLRRGIRRLEPAHVLVWTDEDLRIRRYWHPLADAPARPASYAQGRARLRELLDDTVRLQRAADVPLGAFLSGGVDSTALVGLLARDGDPVRTFSVGFCDDPVFDETRWAREAAAFHDTEHAETHLDAKEICALIPKLLDRLEEPFGSASILPTFVVAREARRRMTVALSGDGADELFGGYEKYLGETFRTWHDRLPAAGRRALRTAAYALPVSRASRAGELARKARRFLDGVHDDPAVRHDAWMRIASPADVGRLLGEDAVRNPGLDLVRELHDDFARHGGTDPLNRVLFTDLSLALPSDMLLKVDTASMLNSLEVRVPYLDPRIVGLAMAMPGSWKMRGTQRKRVLKDAVRDVLPKSIRARGKAGFDVPVGEWMKSELATLFRDTLAREGGLPLDRRVLDGLLDEHLRGRADRSKLLWAVFALRWWEGRSRPAPASTSRPVSTEQVLEATS
ncbi:MAG: asparagine synthase (glutamine-hydrolyzing) [bacterium]